MAGQWKMTIVGGVENGCDFSFPADRHVLVGRSHAADLRLIEQDVSGRHVEFFVEDGVARMHNLSRHRAVLDGVAVPSGATVVIRAGSAVQLGRQVRVRLDELPCGPDGDGEVSEQTLSDMPTYLGAKGDVSVPQETSAAGVGFDFGGEDGPKPGEGPDHGPATRAGSADEILCLQERLDHQRRLRRCAIGVAGVVVALVLAAGLVGLVQWICRGPVLPDASVTWSLQVISAGISEGDASGLVQGAQRWIAQESDYVLDGQVDGVIRVRRKSGSRSGYGYFTCHRGRLCLILVEGGNGRAVPSISSVRQDVEDYFRDLESSRAVNQGFGR